MMVIETHLRHKLEIIIDQPHLRRVVEVLERHTVRGYTVLPTLSGKGSRGDWVPDRLTHADDRVVVVAVMAKEIADETLESLAELFLELPGVAFVSEVRVLRPDRF